MNIFEFSMKLNESLMVLPMNNQHEFMQGLTFPIHALQDGLYQVEMPVGQVDSDTVFF